jgi:hypothetical protein
MINKQIYDEMDATAKHYINAAITTPYFLTLIQRHIHHFNDRLAFLDADSPEFISNYKMLRAQRDAWLGLQELSVRLLTEQPHLANQKLPQPENEGEIG